MLGRRAEYSQANVMEALLDGFVMEDARGPLGLLPLVVEDDTIGSHCHVKHGELTLDVSKLRNISKYHHLTEQRLGNTLSRRNS